MARRKAATLPEAVPTAPIEESASSETETPIRRRRRRRTTTPGAPDYAQETVLLVEAALRSRGIKGATQELLANVVGWARGVRAEGDDIKLITSRPRRQKNQATPDRVSTYEMNRALLDGILAGGITIDVRDNGDLLFLSAEAVGRTTAETPVETTDLSQNPA